MLWHCSDKNLRSASARRNQERVHSLVLQGDIRLLSESVEAYLVVGRQDRLPQHLFKTQKSALCLEVETSLCKVCLVAVKDKDLLHDASIHDNKAQRGLDQLKTPDVSGPDGLAVAAIVVAADPVGPADGQWRLASVPIPYLPGSCQRTLRFRATKRNHVQNVLKLTKVLLHCFFKPTCRQDDVKPHVPIITESPGPVLKSLQASYI